MFLTTRCFSQQERSQNVFPTIWFLLLNCLLRISFLMTLKKSLCYCNNKHSFRYRFYFILFHFIFHIYFSLLFIMGLTGNKEMVFRSSANKRKNKMKKNNIYLPALLQPRHQSCHQCIVLLSHFESFAEFFVWIFYDFPVFCCAIVSHFHQLQPKSIKVWTDIRGKYYFS